MCSHLLEMFASILLLCLISGRVVAQRCSYPCKCPARPIKCPAGTSLVPDACGCCKVCAGQLGDRCSLQAPCDHHKGLYCDTSDVDSASGICVAHEGATCDLGGVVYRSGESFQPSCKYQCTCMDGAVGCIPLCADDLRLPSPECPSPRRVKVDGKCCEEWICRQDEAQNPFDTGLAVYRPVPVYSPKLNGLQANCIVQTTDWSTCSKSCGMGVSTRVTNDNQHCRLEKETRLCLVRPCDARMEDALKKGKKCIRTPRPTKGLRFEFTGCTSVRLYRPKFCGSCADGRCCTPHTSTTMDVEFKCPEGEVFRRKMMLIKTCSCHHDCPRENDIFMSTHHRKMSNDFIKIQRP
ncbi:CCN family member 2-like [Ambystoma mexicanum]|uniref:CCN family member 2-like n=1 Tax=Ambystoma mexicanum TaxID=8296 RepID=UPI0037E717BF